MEPIEIQAIDRFKQGAKRLVSVGSCKPEVGFANGSFDITKKEGVLLVC